MRKTRFTVQRIAMDAVLVALYVGLSFLSIPLGGLKITVEALPVIICAMIFGPVDAAVVGGLAELINQLLTFGLTVTTPLWILPAVVRGLFVGLCMMPVKKRIPVEGIFKSKWVILYYAVCLVSAVMVSCINTFTLYVDSNLFGYYSYAMVFGSFALRIVTGLVSTALMATATAPVVLSLKRANLIR